MSNHQGNEGLLKVGSNAVAEINSWNVSQSASVVDDTTINDVWQTNKPGVKSWNGSLTCFWDETDTTGQGAMTVGSEVTLNLYPEGAATGDTYFTGSAIITSMDVSVPNGAGMITSSISFTGNGALSTTTAA